MATSIADSIRRSRPLLVLQNTVGLLALTLMLAIAVYSTVELAARISARAFVDAKLQELESDLSDHASTASFPRPSDAASAVDTLRARQSQVRSLRETLIALEYAGAQSPSKTIHAVQSQYEQLAQA